MSHIWQLQEAKSKFSELVDRALAQGPQIITRRGVKTVVVLPFSEYERLTRPEVSLTQFLLAAPWAGAELPLGRDPSQPRPLDLEP